MSPKRKLSDVLSDYTPRPGPRFYQRMESAPWNEKENKMKNRSTRTARRGWQIAIGLVLVLVVLAIATPGVRASLSAWLGLSVAPSNQVPAVSMTLVAIPSPTATGTGDRPVAPTATLPAATAAAPTGDRPVAPTATPTGVTATPVRPAELVQLSVQAGWEVLGPVRLPEGYQFKSAYYDPNNQVAFLTYLVTRPLPGAKDPTLTSSSEITLVEALKNDFNPMQVAPSTSVEDLQLNGQPAAYAVGGWDAEFVPDKSDPNGGKMVSTWRNDLKVQNIYWQVGRVYLVLVSADEAVSKQALIDLAASIR